MNLASTPDLKRMIDEELASGTYESPGEVVRDALRLLKESRELRRRRLDALRLEAQVGLDQLERGEYSEYAANEMPRLSEEVKSRGRDRLTATGRSRSAAHPMTCQP